MAWPEGVAALISVLLAAALRGGLVLGKDAPKKAATDDRISSLDDFEVVKTVTVYFEVNKVDLSPESKKTRDELAASGPGANAVVQILAVMHEIPLRRITTPMVYGSTQAVADEATKEGRAQNRRVEVSVLVDKGLSKGAATPK